MFAIAQKYCVGHVFADTILILMIIIILKMILWLYSKCPMANLILCLGVVSAGDWCGGEEGNRGRCSVCHHGSRTPTGWTVQPHLLQRATLGGARHKPVVKTEVCQLKLFQAAYFFLLFFPSICQDPLTTLPFMQAINSPLIMYNKRVPQAQSLIFQQVNNFGAVLLTTGRRTLM